MDKNLVLVTGATGYIANKLVPELLSRNYQVRCLVRQPLRIKSRTWYPDVEVIVGDVMSPTTLEAAVAKVHTAYYLIHNMSSGQGYTELEQTGAQNFAIAAQRAAVEHIIYLGGLVDSLKGISSHMRSRIETGRFLRKYKVPVTEFRASVIVGPGSISFEMIRFMTELMPVIFGPIWLQNRAQPIAVQNVIDYLLMALENKVEPMSIFEIGGPDVMSYADLMLTYGRLRGLWRKFVVFPGIPLWFMAFGVEWMTPVPAVIAKPLVDGMRSESVVQDDSARRVFPDIELISYQAAARDALKYLHPDCIEEIWVNSEQQVNILKSEGFFVDNRWMFVNATPEKVFQAFTTMGGEFGWPYANWLWKIRGWLDKLIGGPGLRNFSGKMQNGNVVDYYRVEALVENRFLRLRSELKAPGLGWMEWKVAIDGNVTILSQTGFFAPRGILGFVYWYALSPFHKLIFKGTMEAIAKQSEAE